MTTTTRSERFWTRLFFWTGIATMLPGLQFVAPTPMLRLMGIELDDSAALLFARHWGLMCLCIGALLVHAARCVPARGPIVFAATVEKLGLVLLVALAWGDPALQRLHGAALFDALCLVFYVTWLWRAARKPVAAPSAS